MNPKEPHERVEYIRFQAFASEIEQMCNVDQDMRKRWGEQEDNIVPDEDVDVDKIHTERMKQIVEEIGWPTISKVGESASYDAWLLVQHADHDVAFQEYCLDLMKQESETEVNKLNIAYLEDRVRVNQGRGQLYGTQFTQENNQHIPRNIEDPEKIDERRASIGMGPLQEQIDLMYKKYPFPK